MREEGTPFAYVLRVRVEEGYMGVIHHTHTHGLKKQSPHCPAACSRMPPPAVITKEEGRRDDIFKRSTDLAYSDRSPHLVDRLARRLMMTQ